MAMFDHDLSYFAARARQERALAESAEDQRVRMVHESLASDYVLRAMKTALEASSMHRLRSRRLPNFRTIHLP